MMMILDVKKFPWSNIPLESIKSKPFQGESLDHAWTYFVMKVPPHATARNMRVELTSNKSIAYEIYARLGGLPYLDVWDYYYANQTSNSNNGSLFKLYDSRDQRVKFEIVYAREGNWTIGLRHPITLINSGSQTTLSISLESCLVQCSDYGTCQDASGLKACSYCQCDGFHGGFDCSVELVSKAEQHLQMFFLVGSNAAAILPAIVALWQKSYAEGVVFLFSGVASAIYHACDLESMCLLKYSVLQFLDFWLSFVAVISIFVYMATISEAAKRTILSIVWILTALMSIGDATSSNNITFVLVIGALSLAVGLLIELSTKYKSVATIFHRPRSISSSWLLELVKKLNRRIRWVFVILGFIALAMAATSWNFENIQNYWICHSIWHISIYTVAFFFICSKVNVDDGFQVVPTQTSDNILA